MFYIKHRRSTNDSPSIAIHAFKPPSKTKSKNSQKTFNQGFLNLITLKTPFPQPSTHLWGPAHCALPCGSPQLAGFGEVLALLQLLLANVAPHQRAAVLVHTMAKVLARHTDA